MAQEAGIRIPPDQWSQLLYGDTAHKSHMQSIIDRVSTRNKMENIGKIEKDKYKLGTCRRHPGRLQKGHLHYPTKCVTV